MINNEHNNQWHSPLATDYENLLKSRLDKQSMQQQIAQVSHLVRNAEQRIIKPLPVIISSNTIEQFEAFVSQIPEVFYQALKSFKSAEAFAKYFSTAEFVYALVEQFPIDTDGVMGRYDLMFENDQMQLLEANISSRVGGWDLDLLGETVINIVKQAAQQNQLPSLDDISHRSGILSYFIATAKVLDKMRQRAEQDGTLDNDAQSRVNVLMYTETKQSTAAFVPVITQIISQIPNWHKVQVLLSDDMTELSFDQHQRVWLNQPEHQPQQIDVVMQLEIPPPEIATENLIKARVANQVLFPDDPIYELFGNKAMLALIHEPFVFEYLSQSQRAWVKRHVPWSVKLDHEQVIWQGKNHQLRTLLTEHQHQFVLKAIRSFGGKEVLVGRFCSQQTWQQAIEQIEQHQQSHAWIAQQYTKSDRILALNNQLDCSEHDPVWGIFAGAGLYGGGIIRMTEANIDNNTGVINAATGATEMLIVEQNR